MNGIIEVAADPGRTNARLFSFEVQLSFAIILCACDFNYIRGCDSQPICDTNRACFSSGDFSLAAFSELFGPGQVCYWKTWFSGSNSPCSSASILDHGLLWSIDFFGF